jgi:ATP-binding cassette subfamily F protein uup
MFDQHRARLEPKVSLRRTLAPFGDSVTFEGREVHVAGWAKRFLFRTDQLETSVGRLSGGEQARVLIARLMLEPADLLLLDEPTNDLDIDTLDVLEESLIEWKGALVLVTHDRYLLDRVSTHLLALDGCGAAVPYADYAQWETSQRSGTPTAVASKQGKFVEPKKATADKPRRLGYKEQREWEQMEGLILAAEGRLEAASRASRDPSVASDHEALHERTLALAAAQSEVDRLYARWAELEGKVKV